MASAWRLGQVSESDAANALETLTEQLVSGQVPWITVLSAQTLEIGKIIRVNLRPDSQ